MESEERQGEVGLVRRAVAGDSSALEALLREHGHPLCADSMTCGTLSREFDDDDLLQVTAIEAILRIGTLQTRTVPGFRAWFRKLAQNNLRDAIRSMQAVKRSPGGRRITRGADGSSARTLLGSVVGGDLTASAIVSEDEQVYRMMAAMEHLPESYRQVIRLMDLAAR